MLLPTPVNALGNIGVVEKVARPFTTNLLETGAYLSVPLVGIATWFSKQRWQEPTTRLLATFLLIVCLLMLGPRLHVNGKELFGMPWKIALHLPLLRDALPERFSLYAFLALAIIISLWLNEPRHRGVKIGPVALMTIFLCPNLYSGFWIDKNDTPRFFGRGEFHHYLNHQDNIILLPYGINGRSMLWQAAAGFYFRMAGGWTSITPLEFQSWPIVNAMLTRSYIPEMTKQLRAFMAAHDVQRILVTDHESGFWEPMLAPLDRSPIAADGIVIYSASPVEQKAFRPFSALEMERRCNLARFSALLVAASDYLRLKGDLAALTPLRAQQLGLLPANWVTDPDVRTNNGLYLGPWGADGIALGVVGSYEGLQNVISKYRAAASQIFFPFPKELNAPPRGDTFMRLMVMVFDRNGLTQAAQSIKPVN
jgi:hypothetical protein